MTGPTPNAPGWAVWTLRTTAMLVALSVLAQALLAGLFVTGDVGMLELHGINAGVVLALVFLQLVAAILLWRPGRGAVWPIWGSGAVFVLAEAQAAFGYARTIEAHIPLGMALFGASTGMLVGVLSPRLRYRRTSTPRRAALAMSTEDSR